MRSRREFITLIGSAAVTWPLAARAQQRKQMRRVGALMPWTASDPQVQARYAAFLQGLQQLGWTVGTNVEIDSRWSAGNEHETRAGRIAAHAPPAATPPRRRAG
jgi:putative ABC transport system substrate-binding protein